MGNLIWFIVTVLMPVPWMFLALTGGGHGAVPAWEQSLLSGVAIVGAAFLLSWGTELLEQDLPSSVALIVLALVAVLPEYAVDLQFAWKAGQDIAYAPLAIANMTGANRILIGVGWPLVLMIYALRARRRGLELDRSRGLDMSALLWASLYAFVPSILGRLSVIDSVVFTGLFLVYVGLAMKSEGAEAEPVGPAAWIEHHASPAQRRAVVVTFMGLAGWIIFKSAEPFAEGLVHTGREAGIDEFVLVQWLAPLASESPEFIVASLFAWRLRGSHGLGAVLSSKVNQWTLLVGAIPIVFSISTGHVAALPLDERQQSELVLTAAQSLFAMALIADFTFSVFEASALAGLFFLQFAFPGTSAHELFAVGYVVGAVALLTASTRRRQAFLRILRFRH